MAKISISDRIEKTERCTPIQRDQEFPVRIRIKLFEIITKVLEEVSTAADYIEVIRVTPHPMTEGQPIETNFIKIDVVMCLAPGFFPKQEETFSCFFNEGEDSERVPELLIRRNLLEKIRCILVAAEKSHEEHRVMASTLAVLIPNLRFNLTKS